MEPTKHMVLADLDREQPRELGFTQGLKGSSFLGSIL